jgi:hypothetical protein
LASCGATVSFAPTQSDLSLSADFAVVFAAYAETSVDSPEECDELEEDEEEG